MIELSNDLINSCYQFAIKVTDTTFENYKSRNLYLTKEKAINDAFKSKLTEWYSYFFLVSRGKIVKEPCMKILPSHKKSFEADLEIIGHGIGIHIKACKPDFHSVLFERSEVNFILKQKNQFIMIIEYTSPKEMKMLSIRHASDHKYLPPKNSNLTTKLAIYL